MEQISRELRLAMFLSGLLIIGFNMYWLIRYDMIWNWFTYESWVMLFVGFILIFPTLKGEKSGDPFVEYGAYFIFIVVACFIVSLTL